MAKKKNVFGIKKGKNPETGEIITNQVIEATWNVVKDYVTGVAGAEYKGFSSKSDAEAYIDSTSTSVPKSTKGSKSTSNTSSNHEPGVLYCYVDGSYNKNIPNYGYGVAYVKDKVVIGIDKGAGTNEAAIDMYQVGGELLGAMKSLVYAKKHGCKEVVIYHDYLGVGKHALGEWKRKTEFSKVYYDWMQKFFRENPQIKISFAKVDAHSGDDFNELADGLAKLSVSIKPDPIYFRMAEKYQILVG